MSLLALDITKVKRLSLGGVKIPEPKVEATPLPQPTQIEKPPTDEEIAYSKLVAINPLIEELVERLNLVSCNTGERIKKVKLRDEINKAQLIELAQRVIEGERSYSKDEIIARLREATNVSQERADKGFNKMLKAGVIEQTINPDLYYLGGSTPF